MKRLLSFLAIVVASLLSIATLSARELNVVPEPSYVDLEAEGEYTVTAKTRIIVVDEMWAPATRFSEDMMATLHLEALQRPGDKIAEIPSGHNDPRQTAAVVKGFDHTQAVGSLQHQIQDQHIRLEV